MSSQEKRHHPVEFCNHVVSLVEQPQVMCKQTCGEKASMLVTLPGGGGVACLNRQPVVTVGHCAPTQPDVLRFNSPVTLPPGTEQLSGQLPLNAWGKFLHQTGVWDY